MKQLLLIATVIFLFLQEGYGQHKNYWTKVNSMPKGGQALRIKTAPKDSKLFALDLTGFGSELQKAPSRENMLSKKELVIDFPDPDGMVKQYKVVEASVMHPDLAAKYPDIKSYAGQGIDDPTATIRFSMSSEMGLHGMVFSGKSNTYYIDPYSTDRKHYTIYKRENLERPSDFQCFTPQVAPPTTSDNHSSLRTNDKKLRKYRLALSCTAEYGNIFAGTSGTATQKKARILAQMNNTITRVNGVYERDLAITLEIVPKNDLIIYYGSVTADPWTDEFNEKTQQIIDAKIGDANYDIGHNFNTTGGGNAGCIGCVCTKGSKGSGFTGRTDPTGDAFDIDYVAHEMGHQFGGFHVQSNVSCRSGNGKSEVEPGSGSSIMGYAGICAPDVQKNSDAYFNYVNIRDISANVQKGISAACAQIINIANNPPTANAGADYTIPKSTAFVLKGKGSDPDGDALTYTWEENDPEDPNTDGAPLPIRTAGPMFRSIASTSSPIRYFPEMSKIVANNLAPTWEVIPSVARTLNFALTVRDNKAGGGQTSDDLMKVTVSGTAGPFIMLYPNTATAWGVGTTRNISWEVAGTNIAPVNCLKVNILLSTDGGFTYPITLAANVPNDGAQDITVPNNISGTCRVKVEAADNIFFDISNSNFSIKANVPCTANVPTGFSAAAINATIAVANWNVVAGATYELQYRVKGATTWTTIAVSPESINIKGLKANTSYEAHVRSKCATSNSAYTATVTFKTPLVSPNYCASTGVNLSYEYIGQVVLGTINNLSSANGYGDFTSISTQLVRGSTNTIKIKPIWPREPGDEGYGVWIDYNRDGDFDDAGELVWSKEAIRDNPATGSFKVPATATLGATRMRVSIASLYIPLSCDDILYGEVEDYTVSIVNTATAAVLASTEASGSSETGRPITSNHETSISHLYPNPAKDYLNLIVSEGTIIKSIRIVSGHGAVVLQAVDNAKEVNVSKLQPGLYMLIMHTDKGAIKNKFIKE